MTEPAIPPPGDPPLKHTAVAEPPDRRRGIDRRQVSRGGRRYSDKVACPVCGCLQSLVKRRRQTKTEQLSGKYWRLRVCEECGHIYRTSEAPE